MVDHYIPKNLEDALNYMKNGKSKVIAGGTDLMIQSRAWSETPPKFTTNMIYILNLQELNYIQSQNDIIRVGAVTPYETLLDNLHTPEIFKKIILELASPALRYVATLSGNIGNASPAGDALVGLYLYDAVITLMSFEGKRHISIDELITGPKKTAIKDTEMITEITLPNLNHTKTSWIKVGGRRADAISKVSFAGLVNLDGETIKDIRIALGAVNATVVRRKEIEKTLIGRTVEDVVKDIDVILSAYEPYIKPIDDQRSNARYRKHVALNLIKDFLLTLTKG